MPVNPHPAATPNPDLDAYNALRMELAGPIRNQYYSGAFGDGVGPEQVNQMIVEALRADPRSEQMLNTQGVQNIVGNTAYRGNQFSNPWVRQGHGGYLGPAIYNAGLAAAGTAFSTIGGEAIGALANGAGAGAGAGEGATLGIGGYAPASSATAGEILGGNAAGINLGAGTVGSTLNLGAGTVGGAGGSLGLGGFGTGAPAAAGPGVGGGVLGQEYIPAATQPLAGQTASTTDYGNMARQIGRLLQGSQQPQQASVPPAMLGNMLGKREDPGKLKLQSLFNYG